MRSDLIKPATIELAFRTAPYLRWQDKREVNNLGIHPFVSLPLSVAISESPIAFYTPDGDVGGMAGIRREDNMSGLIWMQCTTAVEKYPILFLKEAKSWLESISNYHLLHNIADPRNTLHMKLLKHLGFKRLGYVNAGPSRLLYVEFARLQKCVPQ